MNEDISKMTFPEKVEWCYQKLCHINGSDKLRVELARMLSAMGKDAFDKGFKQGRKSVFDILDKIKKDY